MSFFEKNQTRKEDDEKDEGNVTDDEADNEKDDHEGYSE